MNGAVGTVIQVALSVLGLLLSVLVLFMALLSIQAMSGTEPFRELLLFMSVSFALAYGLGASCVLPLTGRYRWWHVAAAFTAGGALGGSAFAAAIRLISVKETQLRAVTDGGPLGIFLLGATIGAVAIPLLIGIPVVRLLRRRQLRAAS